MKLVGNVKYIPTIYQCGEHPKCNYFSNSYRNFKRHKDICLEMSVQTIESVQKFYGNGKGYMAAMVEEGLLPAEALEYRQETFICFDIETLEKRKDFNDSLDTPNSGLNYLAEAKIV